MMVKTRSTSEVTEDVHLARNVQPQCQSNPWCLPRLRGASQSLREQISALSRLSPYQIGARCAAPFSRPHVDFLGSISVWY